MNQFNNCIENLPMHLHHILKNIYKDDKKNCREIHLRVNKPISIMLDNKILFVGENSNTSFLYNDSFYKIKKKDLQECIKMFTNYSIHSSQNQLKEGFITLKGGHRAGFCGYFLGDHNDYTINDFTSINIRIARQINGCADVFLQKIFKYNIHSTLIIGPPTSGKTTMLRDIAKNLASKKVHNQYYKVCVLDQRMEIGAVNDGELQFDLGETIDILSGYPKDIAVNVAIKTLSPQVVVIDEIGSLKEYESMLECLNAGVKVIATAHSDTIKNALNREFIKKAVDEHCFERIVLLSKENPCQIVDFMEL